MRISISKRFVFLSNPRCGSESIRRLLTPYSDILSTKEKPFHHHSNAVTVRNALRRLGFDWEEFTRFTTFRNPWARAVSFWSYAEKNPASVWHRRLAEAADFDAFCALIPPGSSIDRFAGHAGQLIVPEVFRLEDLEQAYPAVASKIGIPTPRKDGPRGWLETPGVVLPHINGAANGDPYQAYFSPRSRTLIAERFAADIELGGYQFD